MKQSFSHGRTKAVGGKSTLGQRCRPRRPCPPPRRPSQKTAPAAARAPRDSTPGQGVVLRQLTEEEKARRSAALPMRVYEVEARKRAEEDTGIAPSKRISWRAGARLPPGARRRGCRKGPRNLPASRRRRRTRRDERRPSRAQPQARGRRPVEEEGKRPPPRRAKGRRQGACGQEKVDDNRRRGRLTVTRALPATMSARAPLPPRRHLQRVSERAQRTSGRPARSDDPETIPGGRTRQPHGTPLGQTSSGADEERPHGDGQRSDRCRYRELVAAE